MELVIGDGLIGRHLYWFIRRLPGVNVGGRFANLGYTSRRGGIRLDLAEGEWELPVCRVAYICIGETSTERCEEDPSGTRLVNVTNTIKLASQLRKSDSFVVFISSERVFNGLESFRGVGDGVCPTTEYGRQKAEVEEGLLLLGCTVVRFAKVLGLRMPLFEDWAEDLRKGVLIHPYSNVSMAPLPVSFVVDALKTIGDRRIGGLLQVSGLYDISYDRIAYHIANYIGADMRLVQPVESDKPHPHTTLKDNFAMANGKDIPGSWRTIYNWCYDRKHFLEGT